MVNLNFFFLFRIIVYLIYEMKFQDIGLFYFYFDKYDIGIDWFND